MIKNSVVFLSNKKLFSFCALLFVLCLNVNIGAQEEENEKEEMLEFAALITPRIERDPKNAGLYLERGKMFRFAHEWEKAAADYAQAERLDPKFYEVELERGKMLIDRKEFAEAEVKLSEFLKLKPDSEDGAMTRAYLRLRLQKYQLAADDFGLTIKNSSAPTPQLYLERAECLMKAAEIEKNPKYIDAAISGIDEGIARLKGNATLQLAAIEIETKRKNYSAAITRINGVMKNLPRKETWLARRGEIEIQTGNSCAARKSFADAIQSFESFAPKPLTETSQSALEKELRTKIKNLANLKCLK